MALAWRWITVFAVFCANVRFCAAQEACYPAGGVAGIIIATIVVTIVVMALTLAAGWRIWKRKRIRRHRSENSNHKPNSQKISGDFSFDNPYFKDQEGGDDEVESGKHGKSRQMNNRNPLRSSKQSDLSTKAKKPRSGKGHHFIFGGGGPIKKQRTQDDSCLAAEPERTVVALKGHDFTGLGFNICGNMRDGILVKDVLHRGPASESGKIKAGDKIISVTVSFTSMVYEDALTILSYASPYDVQLELERISDRSRELQVSPSESKRLGSCSFSSGGQKLFHPLYRSQSIDDLTQIDKDTFPSHGFGPRRSQSVGVAAHKLAAHFKNSDTRLEDKDRVPASVILSTTGSLNEKMLANVIADGGLHKSGLHWEKRFEDNLESENPSTSKSPAKSKVCSKDSTSTMECDTSDMSDNKSPYYKKTRDSSQRGSKSKKNHKKGASNEVLEVKTTAQIHRSEELMRDKRAKTMAEASSAVWHLDKTISDADHAMNSASPYPWNKSKDISAKSRSQKQYECDSDCSGDSLEGDRKRRSKKPKRKTSSLGDLTQLEETVSHNSNGGGYTNRGAMMDSEKDLRNPQKQSRSSRTSESSNYSEQSPFYDPQTNRNHQHGSGTSIVQLSNKEKRLERVVLNAAHSPKLSVKSPNTNPEVFPVKNSNSHQKQGHYSPYINSKSESPRFQNRVPYDSSKADVSSSRNASHHYQSESPVCSLDEKKNKFTNYQPRSLCINYQQSASSRNVQQEETKRNGQSSNSQGMRKTANPVGMFTQINPFQQPSRQRNNVAVKPWSSREDGKKECAIPVNGNDVHYSPSGYPNSTQVTTSDSSNKSRSKNHELYSQTISDSGHSKTVIISTFEGSNRSPPLNFSRSRK